MFVNMTFVAGNCGKENSLIALEVNLIKIDYSGKFKHRVLSTD